MTYKPTFTDYELSPYTGLTKKSWIEAGKYLLDGVFKNLPDFNSPVLVPRSETEVTYPHKDAVGTRLLIEQSAQRFEGLARTLFIAAPLIHIDPNIEICGVKLRDYYKSQILSCCKKGGANFVGSYDDIARLSKNPDGAFQQTVETCALVICLDICRDEIWDTYTKDEKDGIAEFISSYAHAATVPQNWRLFNMLDMAFLHMEGYEIDRDIMLEHAQAILGYYAGDGWYRDGHSFDYYSCWAFNVYIPLWNKWYGCVNAPYISREFENNANTFIKTYPSFFDRDGFTVMWGRSSVYRNAATSPFSENFKLKNPAADPGLSRRIASGSLLQFFTRDDFLKNGVPTMGFYGEFSPLIQGYSCAESAYWLGKAFLCLSLPDEHPFWTARENNGLWDNTEKAEIKETVLNSPAICATNHNANGETVLRTGKVIKCADDIRGMWNYAKLAYNSKYPWEAAPSDDIEAMQYVLKTNDDKYQRPNIVLWSGEKDGVLYRKQFFGASPKNEMHWTRALNLADFPVEYGIIRADKLRLFDSRMQLTLGSYGFPDNGTEISEKENNGAKAVILKGYDKTGQKKQLAMTIYDGWDDIKTIKSSGTNPDSEHSIVVYAVTERKKRYGNDRHILVSQVITKENHEDFSDKELFPIENIVYTDPEKSGGYGPVSIELKNGLTRVISFDGIEGNLKL